MTIPDELSYDRVAARIGRILSSIALAGTVVALLSGGWRWGAGFALGAVISALNYYWLRRLVENLGSDKPRRGSVFFGFRYLFLGGGAYVILKLIPISPKAVFAGVFVLTAAVFVEVAFEIVYARK